MLRDPDYQCKIDVGNEYPPVAVDFETYYEQGKESIKTMGVWSYLHHPKVDAYLVTIYDGENRFTGHPADFDWPSLNGRVLVSWNASFDKLVHDVLVEKGVIEACDFAEWNCAANLCVFLKGPRDLKNGIKQMYDKNVSKDYRQQANGRTVAEMIEAKVWDNVVQSNINDTIDTWQFWVDNIHKWPYLERRLSVMTYEQSHRGMPLDLPLIEKGIATLQAQKKKSALAVPWTDNKAVEAGDHEGVCSVKAMRVTCRAAGVEPPKSTAEDNPGFIEWEKKWGGKFPYISEMRNWRKCNLVEKKMLTMLNRSNPLNGCFSYPQKYFGAHTGRWSGGSKDGTGESGFNPQNFNKEPLHGVDLRRCVIASKGRKLIIADAAQIEPRSMAWLANDQAKLKLMREGMSVYEIHGRQTMGWKGGEMKRENKNLYALAKVRVLGLGYGCGHHKFKVYAETQYDYHMTLQESKRQVDDFRRKERCITRFWNKLAASFADSCDMKPAQWMKDPDSHYELPSGRKIKAHYIELPSGRCLVYLDPQRANKQKHFLKLALDKKAKTKKGQLELEAIAAAVEARGPQAQRPESLDDTDDMKAFLELGGNRPVFFYGGLIAENVVQATARDAFGEMLCRVEDTFGRFAPILFTSHDEMILDADPGISAQEVEEVMAIAPDWMPDCPFGAEAVESDFYMK